MKNYHIRVSALLQQSHIRTTRACEKCDQMVHRHFYRVLANYGIERVGSVDKIENFVYIYIVPAQSVGVAK